MGMKKAISAALATAVCATITLTAHASPQSRWTPGFDVWGGATDTKVQYYFLTDDPYIVYGKEVDHFYTYREQMLAGSDLYVPIGAKDTTKTDEKSASELRNSDSVLATDKQIKADDVTVSYKALVGSDYVDSVTLVSSKKEKLKDLPAGMYAKISFDDTYLPLTQTKVSVRLVLSVNGITFQNTEITFRSYLQNRIETIGRNSVYGAMTPIQFQTTNYGGEASFDFGNGVRYSGMVAPRSRYYLNLDTAPDDYVANMYPDAYIEYYNFKGENDLFAGTGQLEIPISEQKFKEKKTKAEVYLYTLRGNALRAVSLNTAFYNYKTQTITIHTNQLDHYVLSSRPLLKEVNNEEFDVLRSGYATEEVKAESESAAKK